MVYKVSLDNDIRLSLLEKMIKEGTFSLSDAIKVLHEGETEIVTVIHGYTDTTPLNTLLR